MSRIGKKPVSIPSGVKVQSVAGKVTIEGPKGKLDMSFPSIYKVDVSDGKVVVARPSDEKRDKSMHGTIRSLIMNMIVGVTSGYTKELEITGVGFKAQIQGKSLNLQLSYSHPINYAIPEGLTIETPKPTIIVVKGIDKAKVGKAAAEIRDFYRPEPYKGKGIKYAGEHVRRKAGKSVAGAGGGAG